ncbi:unnamed protein product [Caenorhabditis auriculariae]|uniref:Uncharacterized protein n=1 Tax=Caenorhabditis auriculariae TaxID=2777116 RepID=A0A8S1HG69_9PELO|nr:unnamed protein product [Caenorhabditis auriculariae]
MARRLSSVFLLSRSHLSNALRKMTSNASDSAGPQKVVVNDDFQKVEGFDKIASEFFKFSQPSTDVFQPATLKNVRQGHSTAAYGGLIFAQALAAAEQTVDAKFRPHSVHSYFILNVDTAEPIEYRVRRVRDGKSFCTRTVDAVQKDKTAFILQTSFQVEEPDSISHQSTMPEVPQPHSLMSMRQAIPFVKEMVNKGDYTPSKSILYRLNQYDSKIYSSDSDLFEMRSTNLGNYYGFESDKKPALFFWMRARGDLPEDARLHRWLVSYNTDSILAATALSPHYAANNFQPSMVFSLDHTVWFHRTNFRADDWLLFETRSHYAGGGRSLIDGRLWHPDGSLVVSCHQEVLVRTRDKKSQI